MKRPPSVRSKPQFGKCVADGFDMKVQVITPNLHQFAGHIFKGIPATRHKCFHNNNNSKDTAGQLNENRKRPVTVYSKKNSLDILLLLTVFRKGS
jgi:hypothetical protein